MDYRLNEKEAMEVFARSPPIAYMQRIPPKSYKPRHLD